jgi:hypothetical protein
MPITALSGPTIQYGITLSSTSGDGITGQDMEHNEQRAPSIADLGDAMLDPRSAYDYKPGSGVTVQALSFYNNQAIVDYVPTTISTNAFVSTTVVATGVVGAFTLNAGSTARGTVATTIVAPETGNVTGSLLAIDSTNTIISFGSAGTIGSWNPGGGAGRNIVIKKSSTLDGGTYTVAGRDFYGYKMTEQLATNASSQVNGVKAFKYISSITNCTTPTSTGITIGYGDVFGFPMAVPYVGGNVQVWVNSSGNNSSPTSLSTTTTVLASTVATQTATSPDVRGTYSSSTASNGVIRLQMYVTPTASAAGAVTATSVSALFGGTQFSSV